MLPPPQEVIMKCAAAAWIWFVALAAGQALAQNPDGSGRLEATVLPVVVQGSQHSGAAVHRREYQSPVFTVDQIYRSMEGPMAKGTVRVSPGQEPELLWIVRYEAVITAPDGARLSEEFMCHANIDTPDTYGDRFRSGLRIIGNRLAVLSQGQLAIEMPDGFGIPWVSNEPLEITTQVLNHNLVDQTLELRQRVFIDYVRDSDLEKPLKPLIQNGVFGMALVEGDSGYFGIPKDAIDVSRHGQGCAMADSASERHLLRDPLGRSFSAHWVVKPGRHEYHTLVTEMLKLPYDTKAHMIAAHLHPFAVSLELLDLTTDETVISVKATQVGGGRVGLARVQEITSVEGIPMYRNHEYELVSVYDNTSGVDQDSMASMMLFLHAKDMRPRREIRRLLLE